MPHPGLTRDQLRSRRRYAGARPRVVVDSRDARRHLRLVTADFEPDPDRPKTRADCYRVERPCPYVGCRHHLYLDVSERTGSLRINFPDLEPNEMNISCSLDVADNGPATLEEIGEVMNVVRERARQLEAKALRKFRVNSPRLRSEASP